MTSIQASGFSMRLPSTDCSASMECGGTFSGRGSADSFKGTGSDTALHAKRDERTGNRYAFSSVMQGKNCPSAGDRLQS